MTSVKNRVIRAFTTGGSDRNPAWYLNLVANPQVRVEVGGVVTAPEDSSAPAH